MSHGTRYPIPDPAALFREAVDHHRQGRYLDALELYDAAIRLNPKVAAAHCNRGLVLQSLNRLDEALRSYDHAISLKGNFAEAHFNRGNALRDLGKPQAALASYDRAIALNPSYAKAHYNKGNVLQDLANPHDAIGSYERAILLRPDDERLYYKRAEALRGLQRLDESLCDYERAIELEPDFAKAWNKRGEVLRLMDRLDEALESHDRAITLQPDYAAAYWDKSRLKLLMGEFEEGWPLYEWRKKVFKPLGFWTSPDRPAWSGNEDLEGKTLFIHAEQALGDTIQFCRYALLAEQKGAKVILAVQEPLMRLLAGLSPTIRVVGTSDAAPEFDYHVPLLSLPLAFGTEKENIPAQVPYLRAESDKVMEWQNRLGSGGFKVGICWQGASHGNVDAGRSFAAKEFEVLAGIPGVRLISLQKGNGAKQLLDLPSNIRIETLGEEFDAGGDAFLDTAAVMKSLDLVITSDTAIAHLAGALARPTWLALKLVPDWRWLLDRSDSPWYPTMRLFRRTRRSAWAEVFLVMKTQLAEMVGPAASPAVL